MQLDLGLLSYYFFVNALLNFSFLSSCLLLDCLNLFHFSLSVGFLAYIFILLFVIGLEIIIYLPFYLS